MYLGTAVLRNINGSEPRNSQEEIHKIKKPPAKTGGFFYKFFLHPYWILIFLVARSSMAGIVLPPMRLMLYVNVSM